MKRIGWLVAVVTTIVIGFVARSPVLAALRTSRVAAAPEVAKERPRPPTIHAEGRIITRAGGRLVVGAEMPGTIAEVLVQEGTVVKKDDVLVVFKKVEHSARVNEAWAHIAEANAEVALARAETKRTQQLLASGSVSKTEVERATHALNIAAAHRTAAVAIAQQASATVASARIVAPIDGTVIGRMIDPGATVAAGTALIEIADLEHLRVEVEVDEFDIGRITTGMPATIGADAFGEATWSGAVEEVPNVVVPRRLRPQDPAHPTGSGVIDVKVSLGQGSPLALGQRVNVVLTAATGAGVLASGGELPLGDR